MSIFYTTPVGLQNKEAKHSPHGEWPLVGEREAEIPGGHSFPVIDPSKEKSRWTENFQHNCQSFLKDSLSKKQHNSIFF